MSEFLRRLRRLAESRNRYPIRGGSYGIGGSYGSGTRWTGVP